MWLIVVYLTENDPKFGKVTRTAYWDALSGGWNPGVGTAYRTMEDAEMEAILHAASEYIGGVRVESLEEIMTYLYGADWRVS